MPQEFTLHDVVAQISQLSKQLADFANATLARFAQIDHRHTELREAINVLSTDTDERFNRVDERFGKMDERFGKMDERFGKIEGRIGNIENSMVTKHDLNDKFSDLRGQLIIDGKKTDRLIDVLHERKAITSKHRREILAIGQVGHA